MFKIISFLGNVGSLRWWCDKENASQQDKWPLGGLAVKLKELARLFHMLWMGECCQTGSSFLNNSLTSLLSVVNTSSFCTGYLEQGARTGDVRLTLLISYPPPPVSTWTFRDRKGARRRLLWREVRTIGYLKITIRTGTAIENNFDKPKEVLVVLASECLNR